MSTGPTPSSLLISWSNTSQKGFVIGLFSCPSHQSRSQEGCPNLELYAQADRGAWSLHYQVYPTRQRGTAIEIITL